MIVAKFGGSSLCDAMRFRLVASILAENPARSVVVVSAPGARRNGDAKITDLLLSGRREVAISRLDEIASALALPRVPYNPAYGAAFGEFVCAKLLAVLLGWRFQEAIRFDDRDRPFCLPVPPRTVIPGFYGLLPDGSIRTLPRGGSDVAGALAAAAVGAELYENWTDVPGVLAADPKIIDNPARIPEMSALELRLLSQMGALVLHEDALSPVMSRGVPIHLRRTLSPHEPGTMILPDAPDGELALTGIAGRGGVIAAVGRALPRRPETASRLLLALDRAGVPLRSLRMEAGAACLYIGVPESDLNAALRAVYMEIWG